MSKKEFENYQEKRRREFEEFMEKEEKRAHERIPYWIEEGHKLFPKDKHEMWDEIVPVRASDLYHGMELDNILEILKSVYVHITIKKNKTNYTKNTIKDKSLYRISKYSTISVPFSHKNFNGVKIFSKNVTLDSAYLDITGMSKKEFENYQE